MGCFAAFEYIQQEVHDISMFFFHTHRVLPSSILAPKVLWNGLTLFAANITAKKIFGLGSGRTNHVADDIAEAGYLVICPAFFEVCFLGFFVFNI